MTKDLDTKVRHVIRLGRQLEVEVVDLDAVSTKDKVLSALQPMITGDDGDPLASSERAEMRVTECGQPGVDCYRPGPCINGQLDRVIVGWTFCRVRPRREEPIKCFLYHGYGYLSRDCKGPDLTDAFRKFGQAEHQERACTAAGDSCVACERKGLPKLTHKPGSGTCSARRKAKGLEMAESLSMQSKRSVVARYDLQKLLGFCRSTYTGASRPGI